LHFYIILCKTGGLDNTLGTHTAIEPFQIQIQKNIQSNFSSGLLCIGTQLAFDVQQDTFLETYLNFRIKNVHHRKCLHKKYIPKIVLSQYLYIEYIPNSRLFFTTYLDYPHRF